MIVSLSIPQQLVQKLDNLAKSGGYASRSDALRSLIREYRARDETAPEDARLVRVFVISLIYEKGGVAERRISDVRHEYEEIESNMHMHLDERNCVEIMIMKGHPLRVNALLKSLRGVHKVKDIRVLDTVCEE
jgi:CopG family nickel-responsive transcriptional regulator